MEKNTELIIEAIIKEIMEKMNIDNDSIKVNKNIVIVLGRKEKLPREILEKYDCRDINYCSECKAVNKYSAIYITEMNCTQLCDVALGRADSQYTSLVHQSLLEGTPVYMVANALSYEKYKETASPKLFLTLEQYKNKLIDYGVIILGTDEEKTTRCEKNLCNEQNMKDCKKKLITAALAQEMIKTGNKQLVFSSETIITPSAIDIFKGAKVQITKEQGENR